MVFLKELPQFVQNYYLMPFLERVGMLFSSLLMFAVLVFQDGVFKGTPTVCIELLSDAISRKSWNVVFILINVCCALHVCLMDFLLNITLSGSLQKLSLLSYFLTDGSNSNIKADSVNIHLEELHPCDGISFFLFPFMKVLLYLLPTASNALNMCEAHDMRAQIYLNRICIKREIIGYKGI